MSNWFAFFIVFWMIILISLVAIGGYFMFRKFLKSMPKQDGKSDLDWQDYYIENSQHLWTDDTKELLEELVQPVPELFRDVARRSIAGKIGKLAIEENAPEITQDLVIKGYILATPARDHKWLVAHLQEKQIDFTPYEKHLKLKI
ncbi:DUF2621 domain-containing protein [Ammoniphilus resinae]|uniref:DUF2621 domain-containing protein n=1 Tax=Ammoniphilus resinae TaxID=861532 RepID=A0ABS4GLP1_9BACL|nr:DUF2621 domain-containing protein [Ammoniphilus resinae]MBP1931164.1 hypothetical protein [Ammoniphilus resinae]